MRHSKTSASLLLKNSYHTFALCCCKFFLVIKTPDDLWKYAALIVVSNFLNYICSFIYSKRYTHFKLLSIRFSRYDLQKYLPALFFILILKNSNMFYTVLDRIMLGSFEGSQSVAYYSVGQRIMEMIRALLITITYVSLPRLSYYLSNDVSLYRDNLQKLVRVGFLLSLPLSVGLCLLGKDIVTLFAGEQYLAAVYPLSVFAVRIVTLLIENITATQILFLHNRAKNSSNYQYCMGNRKFSLQLFLVSLGCTFPYDSNTFDFMYGIWGACY